MHRRADGGGKSEAVILFGIVYSAEIEACGETPAELCKRAGFKPAPSGKYSYATNIGRGMNLARAGVRGPEC